MHTLFAIINIISEKKIVYKILFKKDNWHERCKK